MKDFSGLDLWAHLCSLRSHSVLALPPNEFRSDEPGLRDSINSEISLELSLGFFPVVLEQIK